MLRLPARPVLLAVLAAALPATAAAQRAASAVVVEAAGGAPAGPTAAAGRAVEYLYDDGAANVNIGPPSTFDPDMLWGNYYFTEAGGEVITEIAVAFGSTFPSAGAGVTFWLLDDPDADGDPRDATALASVDATPDVFGNTFFRVAIPPTAVSGAFFVGASAFLQGGEDRPARVDTGARADRSWFFYAPDIAATINDLAAAPFGTRMDDQANVPFPGAFMIRALGQPSGTTGTTGAPTAAALALHAAAPNPVAGATTLRFDLPAAGGATLDVVDALGRRVATLADGTFAAGTHAARWDARGLAPGVYVARLRTGEGVRTARLVVAR